MDNNGSSVFDVLINPDCVLLLKTDTTMGLGTPGLFVLLEGRMEIVTIAEVRAVASAGVGR